MSKLPLHQVVIPEEQEESSEEKADSPSRFNDYSSQRDDEL